MVKYRVNNIEQIRDIYKSFFEHTYDMYEHNFDGKIITNKTNMQEFFEKY